MVVSWAHVGQRGYRHINCQPQSYVISEFARRNWLVEEKMTVKIKESSVVRRSVIKNVIVFYKSN